MDPIAGDPAPTAARRPRRTGAGHGASRPGSGSSRGGGWSTRSGRSRSCPPTRSRRSTAPRCGSSRDRRRGPRRPGARRVPAAPGRPSIATTRRVRLDPAHVEALVATAPSRFTLHARNPDRDVVFGGANLVFGAVGGPAFVTDLDRGRRPGQRRRLPRLRPRHRRARHHPPGGRRTARADRPAGRDAPPRHVPDVRDAARQDVAVPRLRRDRRRRRDRGRGRSSAASTATRSSASRAS